MNVRVRVVCDRCGWKPPRRPWDCKPLTACPVEGCAGLLVLPLDLRFVSALERATMAVALERLLERLELLLERQRRRVQSVRRQVRNSPPLLDDSAPAAARLDALHLAGLAEGLEVHRAELEAEVRALELEELAAKRGRRGRR